MSLSLTGVCGDVVGVRAEDLGEADRTQFLSQLSLVFGTQRGEEVDLLRFGLLAGSGDPIEREMAAVFEFLNLGVGEEAAIAPDLEVSEIKRIEAHLDLLTREKGVDPVPVSLERERCSAGDGAFVAPEEGLAQQNRVGGAQRGRRAAGLEALEGSGPGFGVDAAVVDELNPGVKRGVEIVKGGELRVVGLGKKLTADGPEEALDLAFAGGSKRCRVDGADTQRGAGGGELGRDVDLPVVDIQPRGDAAAEDGELENPFQARESFLEEELAVGNQAGVVVDEAEKCRSPKLPGSLGIGEVGTDEHVSPPQIVGPLPLEATEGFAGPLEFLAGRAATKEDAPKGARSDRQPGRKGGIAREDLDDGRGASGGNFLTQRDRFLDQLGRDSTRLARIGAGLGFEGLEATAAVARQIAPHGIRIDPGAGREGDQLRLAGDGAQMSGDLTAFEPTMEQGDDEAVAEQGDLGAPLFFGRESVVFRGVHRSPWALWPRRGSP